MTNNEELGKLLYDHKKCPHCHIQLTQIKTNTGSPYWALMGVKEIHEIILGEVPIKTKVLDPSQMCSMLLFRCPKCCYLGLFDTEEA